MQTSVEKPKRQLRFEALHRVHIAFQQKLTLFLSHGGYRLYTGSLGTRRIDPAQPLGPVDNPGRFIHRASKTLQASPTTSTLRQRTRSLLHLRSTTTTDDRNVYITFCRIACHPLPVLVRRQREHDVCLCYPPAVGTFLSHMHVEKGGNVLMLCAACRDLVKVSVLH